MFHYINDDLLNLKYCNRFLREYAHKKGYDYFDYLWAIEQYRSFRIGNNLFYHRKKIEKMLDLHLKNRNIHNQNTNIN